LSGGDFGFEVWIFEKLIEIILVGPSSCTTKNSDNKIQ